MAANLKGRAIAGSFGKRLANQIWAAPAKDPASLPASSARKVAYSSAVYDKNIDEQVCPAVVPDYVIDTKSDKYWGPHPKTGVFGPADLNSRGPGGGGESAVFRQSGNDTAPSVLDQTAWFRPLEDVEKPPVA